MVLIKSLWDTSTIGVRSNNIAFQEGIGVIVEFDIQHLEGVDFFVHDEDLFAVSPNKERVNAIVGILVDHQPHDFLLEHTLLNVICEHY